jgi:hypothetical protein
MRLSDVFRLPPDITIPNSFINIYSGLSPERRKFNGSIEESES